MNKIVNGWFSEVSTTMWPGQAMSIEVEEVLFHEKSLYQDVLVFKSKTYGNVLVLDGAIQVTERDEFAYQEMIAHLPLFSHPNPKKVLVIGGGDGGVLREIAKHPGVEEIHICEIDQMVIDVSKKYLPSLASGYSDPRVQVHVMDGAIFMAENKGQFDVIITDSSDPEGPAETLFSENYFRSLNECLTPSGIIATQAECIWLHLDLIKKVSGSLKNVYPKVEYSFISIPTYPSGTIGFFLCTKDGHSCKAPARNLTQDVQDKLKYYNPAIHAASFVLPQFAQAKLQL